MFTQLHDTGVHGDDNDKGIFVHSSPEVDGGEVSEAPELTDTG